MVTLEKMVEKENKCLQTCKRMNSVVKKEYVERVESLPTEKDYTETSRSDTDATSVSKNSQ